MSFSGTMRTIGRCVAVCLGFALLVCITWIGLYRYTHILDETPGVVSAPRYDLPSKLCLTADFCDTFSRADTVDGAPLGRGETNSSILLLAYDERGYPMVPARKGSINDLALTLSPEPGGFADRTFYAVVDAEDIGGDAWKSFHLRYRWLPAQISGSRPTSPSTLALGFSTDPDKPDSTDRLIHNLPVHLVVTRSRTALQFRDNGAAAPFPTLGEIMHSMPVDDTEHTTSISLRNDTVIVRTDDSPPLIVRHAKFAQEARFSFFEITSNTENVIDRVEITEVGGSISPAEIVPDHVPAPPKVYKPPLIGPPTPKWVAGKTVSVVVPSGYTSNAGKAVVTAYRWQYQAVDGWSDMSGDATVEVLQTSAINDSGKILSCLVTLTNAAGSTTVRSASSGVLE